MSAALSRLRKKAAELEQKRQFDRALEVYIQLLDEGGKDLGDEDVPLFNRVGDMLMRKGSVTEALGYYERAVDLYAERGFLNNAIALCSKILRQSPGRAAVYYKLGRISARKGFKSDARKNFLEYADRMQKAGQSEEAFRALKEFASLYPDQDDVRLILAELLSRENRKGEALEQLQALYQKLEAEGRRAEARATIDRMRAIDPSVTPRDAGVLAVPAPGDLVFLDLSEEEPRVLRP
ncbi:MAG: tetratricopeptide repeat protein, partial [Gemmatimonadaceae bacterium]|nr:tetratricopeptide repeat protein [Gemmatimonadaceae bacterium]